MPTSDKPQTPPTRFTTERVIPTFFAADSAQQGANGASAKKVLRRFAGVPYTGGVIRNHWWWGDVAFDLDTMDIEGGTGGKIAALMGHDRNKRAGYATEKSISYETGFMVTGNLLSNEHGQAVANDSDEGFPWQMSVDIDPGSIEDIKSGTSVQLNGKQFSGPLTVFRNSRISEISFTATGWDANTIATAMSQGQGQQHQPPNPKEFSMTPEEMQAEIARLNTANTALAQTNTTLTQTNTGLIGQIDQFSHATREGLIKTLFSDIGRTFDPNAVEVKTLFSLDQPSFDAMAVMMRASATKPPPPPAVSGLFEHLASSGSPSAPQGGGQNQMQNGPGTAGPIDALANDAKKRAERFGKERANDPRGRMPISA